MGPTAGVMGGWALMFGYTLTGMSTLCGFAIIADLLLGQILGPLTVGGDSGLDRVQIDDSADGPDSFFIDATTVRRNGRTLLRHGGIEVFDLLP